MTTTQHLTHLESTGLLRLAQNQPELEYLFRHALVQDAVYKSMLRQDRSRLHQQVAETLERLYADRLDELAPVLGNHFAIANDNQRALQYFTLAGDAAFRIYANAEAAGHYRRAVEFARKSETGSKELIHLYTNLGRVLELNSQFAEALANSQEMEALAQQGNNLSLKLAALTARIPLYAAPTPLHDPAQGLVLGKEALNLARDLGDGAAEAKVLWNLSLASFWSGHIAEAITCGEEAVALAQKLGQPELQAFALNDLCLIFMSSRFERAKAALQEARHLWRELGNLPMLTDSLSLSLGVSIFAGEYAQAITFSNEAFEISQTTNNLWGQSFSQMLVDLAYWEQGRPDRAISLAEESLRLSKLSGFVAPKVFTQANLALIYGRLGDVERGLKMAQLAATAAKTEIPSFKMYALGALAQLYLLQGNLVEAEKIVKESKKDPIRQIYATYYLPVAIAEAKLTFQQGHYAHTITVTESWLTTIRQTGMHAYTPPILYMQAQALLALGQDQAAHERFLEARTAAEAIGSRWMLWQILAALRQIEPDPTTAGQLHQQACQIIKDIAHHTPAELRESFLNRPDIQSVMK